MFAFVFLSRLFVALEKWRGKYDVIDRKYFDLNKPIKRNF